jgi:hypothetical protein
MENGMRLPPDTFASFDFYEQLLSGAEFTVCFNLELFTVSLSAHKSPR